MKFDVLVLQNGIVIVQTTAKKDKKGLWTCQFFFLLIRSIDLDAILISVPV